MIEPIEHFMLVEEPEINKEIHIFSKHLIYYCYYLQHKLINKSNFYGFLNLTWNMPRELYLVDIDSYVFYCDRERVGENSKGIFDIAEPTWIHSSRTLIMEFAIKHLVLKHNKQCDQEDTPSISVPESCGYYV